MQTQSTFTNWDFDDTWIMICGSYPLLRNVSPFSGSGSGMEADPYQITDVCELQEMILDRDAHYKVMNNIDASQTSGWYGGKGFEPVGYHQWKKPLLAFTGSLNGQNYEVSELLINRPTEDDVGLFGSVDDNSRIYNIHLKSFSVSGNESVGCLSGSIFSYDTDSEVKVYNSSASGTVSGEIEVGIFCGVIYSTYGKCFVYDCESSGYGTGGDWKLGGFTGLIAGLKITAETYVTNCQSSATLTGHTSAGGFVGLAGSFNSKTEIKFCESSGNVEGIYEIGGFCGRSTALYEGTGSTISKCKSTCDVDGERWVGGFTGYHNPNQETSAIIENSWGGGSVSGIRDVGGFAGGVSTESTGSLAKIENCYSKATSVSASSGTVGGFCGYMENGPGTEEINNCFWDETLAGNDNSLGSGKTTAEMKTQSTFTSAGWDFTDIWDIRISKNDGYPRLFPGMDEDPEKYPDCSSAGGQASPAKIFLYYDAPSGIENCDGYLVAMNECSPVTEEPLDRRGYTVNLPISSNDYVAAIVTSPNSTTLEIAGITANRNIYIKIFPFNWDGSDSETYNYLTEGTPAWTICNTDGTTEIDIEKNNMYIGGTVTYKALESISICTNTGSFFIVPSGGDCTMRAGQSITINPGFRAYSGSSFHAIVENCGSFTARKAAPEETPQPIKGLPPAEENEEFIIYPNPNDGEFTLSFKKPFKGKYDIEIINLLGKRAYFQRGVSSQNTSIRLQQKSSGVYFLKLIKNGEIRVRKFIVR